VADESRRYVRADRLVPPGRDPCRVVYAFTLLGKDGEHHPAPYRAILSTIRLLNGRPLWETRLEVQAADVDPNGVYTDAVIKTDP
jgi:hypothetical protein